jgi:hypothetical protein
LLLRPHYSLLPSLTYSSLLRPPSSFFPLLYFSFYLFSFYLSSISLLLFHFLFLYLFLNLYLYPNLYYSAGVDAAVPGSQHALSPCFF